MPANTKMNITYPHYVVSNTLISVGIDHVPYLGKPTRRSANRPMKLGIGHRIAGER
ncbi:unnamed protein product [Arabis nemorensis]|uniref:Uncharacterized protein n=1 Tax=Arabis nemorensis TaxID=586526 RepID=A0A565CR37_9BRAS|nr:unnamed protein product [Arabis nemorensis]